MELLNSKLVAKYLGRTEPAIRNMVLRRQIPFRKAGGRLTFIKEEIDHWLQSSAGLTFDQWKKQNEQH